MTDAELARAMHVSAKIGLSLPPSAVDQPFMLRLFFDGEAAGNTAGTRHMRRVAATRRRRRRC